MQISAPRKDYHRGEGSDLSSEEVMNKCQDTHETKTGADTILRQNPPGRPVLVDLECI